jgi:putative DNA primase/helicase
VPDKDPLQQWDEGGRPAARKGNGKARPQKLALPPSLPAGMPEASVYGFEMRADGLYRIPSSTDRTPFKVCGRFEVLAESRSENQDEWGLLLRWSDRDGLPHEWIMPRRLLAGEAAEVRARLSACGLDVSANDGARRALVEFLSSVRVSARVRTVSRTGWYFPRDGAPLFVLPDRTFGTAQDEIVRLDVEPPPKIYAARGSLEEWRHEVAARCVGNSRLLLSVSASFVAPLLGLTRDEGGALSWNAETSRGKTTLLDAAASSWGPPSKSYRDAFTRTWNTTHSALEATACGHNHTFLPIDEIGEADPAILEGIIYMVGGGVGRTRALPSGGNRQTASFLTFILSTGELTASRMIERAGKHAKAGIESRFLDVAAEIAGGFGVFEQLHGTPNGDAFAQALRKAVLENHGTAGPAFVAWLTEQVAIVPDFVAIEVLAPLASWLKDHVPPGADGQVQRAARRLGMIAVAGELATRLGVTAWPSGAAASACARIFHEWLAERGGTGSREDQRLFEAFRRFLMRHGSSRFQRVRERDEGAQNEPPVPAGDRTVDRAGWCWEGEISPVGERFIVHGIAPEVFDAEIAGPLGLTGRDARARLGRAGLIEGHKESGKLRWVFRPKRIPGVGRPWLVVVAKTAWDGEPGE